MTRNKLLSAALAATVAGLTLLVGATGATVAFASAERTTGTLNLRAVAAINSLPGQCPPGVTATFCATRTGIGPAPGLGTMTNRYTFVVDVGPPACPAGFGRTRAYPVQLVVAGKGAIDLTLAPGAECVDEDNLGAARAQTQSFTITGGTGIYTGASGSGAVERFLGEATDSGRVGRDTWVGTVVVPNLEFDVTPPTLSGATNRTVRAKRGAKAARVVFRVGASDDRDGSVAVTCDPRSGSAFKLGKTRVTCAATDSSANTALSRFTVTVRRPPR